MLNFSLKKLYLKKNLCYISNNNNTNHNMEEEE